MTNAIIMAGGFGSRLRPLTDDTPKPMLPVQGRPVLDYSVAQLCHFGIFDVVFSLGYQPEKVMEWAIGYQNILPHFVVEDTPLGTLGGVRAAKNLLSDTFVVLSGDGINNIDLNAMLNRHLATKAEVTIAIKKVENPRLYGLVEAAEDGFVESFLEKPHSVTVPSFVNCGTYVVSKSALDLVQKTPCDFAQDLFPLLVERGSLAYYVHRGFWLDIGDFETLSAAQNKQDLAAFESVKNTFAHKSGSNV